MSFKELPYLTNVVVLDYEASSTSQESYPIEVGLAFGDGDSESHLIKPPKNSDWTEWNDWVENNVHHISRDMLDQHGESPRDVALWLNDVLRDKTVLCDSPKALLDNFWNKRLYKLFEEAGIDPAFQIECVYDYISPYDSALEQAYYNVGNGEDKTHRAGEDAQYLMEILARYYQIKCPDMLSDRSYETPCEP